MPKNKGHTTKGGRKDMESDLMHEMDLIEMFAVLDLIYEQKSPEETDYLSNN